MDLILVLEIEQWAKENYDEGGHWILETMTTQEIVDEFKSLSEAQKYCKRMQDYYQDVANA